MVCVRVSRTVLSLCSGMSATEKVTRSLLKRKINLGNNAMKASLRPGMRKDIRLLIHIVLI